MSDKNSFAEWLKAELQDRGWSRSEAARRGGISSSILDKIINGHSRPGLNFYKGLAKAFNMSLVDVLARAGEYKPADIDVEQLFSDWITQKYIEWRGNATGHKRTMREFAEKYVGVSQSLMVQWMKGAKSPRSYQTISKLAAKFGDEVYHVLEIQSPSVSVADTFAQWLQGEMVAREWSQAELARRANITKGAISHVLNETRRPGEALCKAIAQALEYPPEVIFRAAGLLPPTHEITPQMSAVIEAMSNLPEIWQAEIVAFAQRQRHFYEMLKVGSDAVAQKEIA